MRRSIRSFAPSYVRPKISSHRCGDNFFKSTSIIAIFCLFSQYVIHESVNQIQEISQTNQRVDLAGSIQSKSGASSSAVLGSEAASTESLSAEWRVPIIAQSASNLEEAQTFVKVPLQQTLAVVCHDLWPTSESIYLLTVVESLIKQGMSAEVLTQNDGVMRFRWEALGVQVIYLNGTAQNTPLINWLNYDIVVASSLSVKASVAGLANDPFTQVPLVWILHSDALPARLLQYVQRGNHSLLSHWSKLMSRPHHLVVTSPEHKPSFSQFSPLLYPRPVLISGTPDWLLQADQFLLSHDRQVARRHLALRSSDFVVLVSCTSGHRDEDGADLSLWRQHAWIMRAMKLVGSRSFRNGRRKDGRVLGSLKLIMRRVQGLPRNYSSILETLSNLVGLPAGTVQLAEEDGLRYALAADSVLYCGDSGSSGKFPPFLIKVMALGCVPVAPLYSVFEAEITPRLNGMLYLPAKPNSLTSAFMYLTANRTLAMAELSRKARESAMRVGVDGVTHQFRKMVEKYAGPLGQGLSRVQGKKQAKSERPEGEKRRQRGRKRTGMFWSWPRDHFCLNGTFSERGCLVKGMEKLWQENKGFMQGSRESQGNIPVPTLKNATRFVSPFGNETTAESVRRHGSQVAEGRSDAVVNGFREPSEPSSNPNQEESRFTGGSGEDEVFHAVEASQKEGEGQEGCPPNCITDRILLTEMDPFEEKKSAEEELEEKRSEEETLEREELAERVPKIYPSLDEMNKEARRAEKSPIQEKDEGDVFRLGQAICVYESFIGEGSWPNLHSGSLYYRGVSLKLGGKRPSEDDVEIAERLPLFQAEYFADAWGDLSAMFALAFRMNEVHKHPWIGFQPWEVSLQDLALTEDALSSVVKAVESNEFGDAVFFWVPSKTIPGTLFRLNNPPHSNSTLNSQTEGMREDFWGSCDNQNMGLCRQVFLEGFRGAFQLSKAWDKVPPMLLDGDPWVAKNAWIMPSASFLEFVMFSRLFVDAIHEAFGRIHQSSGVCPLARTHLEMKQCFKGLFETLVNVWAYHSGRRMVFVDPKTGRFRERHPLDHRRGSAKMWFKFFQYHTLKALDEDRAEASEEEPFRPRVWAKTGEVWWKGIRARKKHEKERRMKEKMEASKLRGEEHKQKPLGKPYKAHKIKVQK